MARKDSSVAIAQLKACLSGCFWCLPKDLGSLVSLLFNLEKSSSKDTKDLHIGTFQTSMTRWTLQMASWPCGVAPPSARPDVTIVTCDSK